ncbi:MAG: carbohydrate ABC transporter permease [Deltaproteobacteria bacterium]|nr:carbohydrate ABC transporter permease [Deltaproteobacteria bacterium]
MSWSNLMAKTGFMLIVAITVLLSLLPFLWFLLTSLKTPIEVTAIPPALIPSFSLDFYQSAFKSYNLQLYLKNSLIVALSTTLICMVLATFAGYALSRTKIRGKGVILGLFLAVSMFPQISIAGPVWRILRDFGWLNSYQGLILPYVALTLPLAVWIMATFFRDFPWELEHAALIDGSSRIGAIFRVVLPLSAPGFFTASILVFIYTWNEFFFALLIMTDPSMQTLPVGIALFPGEFTMPWGEIAAASVVSTIPLIFMVLIFQRRIIQGLTAGSVKG